MTIDEILYKIICEVSGCYDDEEVTDKKAIAQAKAELRKLIEGKKQHYCTNCYLSEDETRDIKAHNHALDVVIELLK